MKRIISLLVVICLLATVSVAAETDLSKVLGKEPGDANPLYTQRFGADPWGMEYDGRMYVYMTNDTPMFDANGKIQSNTYGNIHHINVISSDDLVNWTDHGSIPVSGSGGIAKWAGNSWAPSVVCKKIDGKDQFFLYFANSGNGVGVLQGDSPVGPWTDPLGKNLVSHSTPNCSSKLVPWCFDPAVFIDDDGQAYLYFGGGTPTGQEAAHPKSARVVKLGADMVSIEGTPQEIDAPYFFEAADMDKIGGKYYFSYCSNWSSPGYKAGVTPGNAQIAYMVADSPMGPFEYVDTILKNPGELFVNYYNNNHQCITEFQGKWYLLYHATLVAHAMGYKQNYRSTHINEITVGADGKLAEVKGDRKGVSQIKNLDVSVRVEAETVAWNGGISTVMQDPTTSSSANMFVTGLHNGDWLAVSKADFGAEGASVFTANVAGKRGGTIELRLDSADGTLIGKLEVGSGDGNFWQTLTADVSGAAGVHDLYMIFKGTANAVELFNIDWWSFGSVESDSFGDIKGHWAHDAIEEVAARGLFQGTSDNRFTPNSNMTRAMFVTVLSRLDGVELVTPSEQRFSDVAQEAWYGAAVEWAAWNGIDAGEGDKFRPNDYITRQEFSLMLYNYALYNGYELPADTGEAFADESEISTAALGAVKAMRALGVVTGKPGNRYDPEGEATRAEVATIFTRFTKIFE